MSPVGGRQEPADRCADDVLERRVDELGEALVAVDDVAAGR